MIVRDANDENDKIYDRPALKNRALYHFYGSKGIFDLEYHHLICISSSKSKVTLDKIYIASMEELRRPEHDYHPKTIE